MVDASHDDCYVSAQSRPNFASRPFIVTPRSIPDFTIPDLNSTKCINSEEKDLSPTVHRRHSSFTTTTQGGTAGTGTLNTDYYPMTLPPTGGIDSSKRLGTESPKSHHDDSVNNTNSRDSARSVSPGGHLDVGGGGGLGISDQNSVYIRRHSWDSRRCRQPKTMPNIKICISQPGPSRDASHAGSKSSLVDVIPPSDANSSNAGSRRGSNCRGGGAGGSRRASNAFSYFENCRNKKSMRRRRKGSATPRALSSVDLTCCCENSLGDLNLGPANSDDTDQFQQGRKNSIFDNRQMGKALSSLLSPFRNGGAQTGNCNMIAASHNFCSLQKFPCSNSSSQCCSACSSRRSSFDPPTPELGFLEVEAIWNRDTMVLTITLLNGRDIDAPFKGKLSVNDQCFFKMALMNTNSKQAQKQESKAFTNVKDPFFNESFHFYAITAEDLQNNLAAVKIKCFARSSTIRRKRVISRCVLKLDSLEHNKITKFWLALEEQAIMKSIGTLTFSLRFTRDGSLQLYNISAKDLPKKLLKFSADTYLRIKFDDKDQVKNSSGPMVHKTSIVENNPNPGFEESYTFRFPPRKIHECEMEISLYQKSKLKGEVLVGQIKLGPNSTEVSEFEHWTSVVSNPGVAQEQTHFLMEPDVS